MKSSCFGTPVLGDQSACLIYIVFEPMLVLGIVVRVTGPCLHSVNGFFQGFYQLFNSGIPLCAEGRQLFYLFQPVLG